MALTCDCGEELVVHTSGTTQLTYCQNCGREEERLVARARAAPIISLTRAAILKKLKQPPAPPQKKPKQIRDRADYVRRR